MAVERVAGEQIEAGSVAAEVAALWNGRELASLASDATRFVTAGTATDWGLAAAADSPIPPITLGGGIPDPEMLPRAELLDAMRRAFAVEDDGPLRYGGPFGFDPLREQLAARYERDYGLPVGPESFMLTNGSAGAIDLVCKTLISPGDVVLAEAPTFSGTLRTFRGNQAAVRSVETDADGLLTDDLERVIREVEAEGRRVKLIYTIANFHNPTGVALPDDRRRELLRVAARHGAFILDDDAYGELFFGERAPQALSAMSELRGVITVGSFSKTVATGLRIGWIHAEADLIELCSRMRFDMGNSPVLHHMLAEYLADGRLDRHLERTRPFYAKKLDILAAALTEFAEPYLTFQRPKGGFFLWVKLQAGLTAEAVHAAGVQEGVIVPMGHAFFPDQVDSTGEHVRLAFSWTATEDLREAAARLARACASAADGR